MKHVDSAIIIIFNQTRDKVLMLERVKNQFGFDWGFICGKLENGETPVDGAKRELKEETGITQVSLKEFKKVRYEKDNQIYFHHYFCAKVREDTKITLQSTEAKAARWFRINQLPDSRAPDDPIEALEFI